MSDRPPLEWLFGAPGSSRYLSWQINSCIPAMAAFACCGFELVRVGRATYAWVFAGMFVAFGLLLLRDVRRRRNVIVEERLRSNCCPTCGYSRSGTVSGVCPECGTGC